MAKTIILNEKNALIEEIIGLIAHKPLQYRVNYEVFLNKRDIAQLIELRKGLKPKTNIFQKSDIPKQTILTNKDILYKALYQKGIIGYNRFKKLTKYGQIDKRKLNDKEIRHLYYYLIKLKQNANKTIKQRSKRKQNGLKFILKVNSELRNVSINKSGFNALINISPTSNDLRLIEENFLIPQIKKDRVKRLIKESGKPQ